jgi:L-ascorbate metabolism protein UlaG (beta-lactamase superfamily)
MNDSVRGPAPPLRRLSWAGIELTSDTSRLLIDPLQYTAPLAGFLGEPRWRLEPIDIGGRTWALVTHLHADHCDRQLLGRLEQGRVLCHQAIAEQLVHEQVPVVGVELWDMVDIGPFRATPVPAQDWRGADQVAWVIEIDRMRIIQCGDTIWHGSWYEIQRRFGSFDVAFLPINAVLAQLEGFTPTEGPSTLTPEQAIEAAVVLQASTACAIHHGLFHNPPRYVESANVVARFLRAGARRGVLAIAPEDGAAVAIE